MLQAVPLGIPMVLHGAVSLDSNLTAFARRHDAADGQGSSVLAHEPHQLLGLCRVRRYRARERDLAVSNAYEVPTL